MVYSSLQMFYEKKEAATLQRPNLHIYPSQLAFGTPTQLIRALRIARSCRAH